MKYVPDTNESRTSLTELAQETKNLNSQASEINKQIQSASILQEQAMNKLAQDRLDAEKDYQQVLIQHEALTMTTKMQHLKAINTLKKQLHIDEVKRDNDLQELRNNNEAHLFSLQDKLANETNSKKIRALKKQIKQESKLNKKEEDAKNKQNENYEKNHLKERIKANKEANIQIGKSYESALKDKGIISKFKATKDTYNAYKENGASSSAAGLATGLKALDAGIQSLANFAQKLDSQVAEIASYQNNVNTRLNGSEKTYATASKVLLGAVGVSPFVKSAHVLKNLDELVDKGINYNVEQRAFLQTISDSIATTFDAANGTLLKLIRNQQGDTTAARLGMEASLNAYLNSMYQTTEYLSDVSDTVADSIYEATAQMTAREGVGFEYQVQKWLGSLYSVGMSNSSISNIASALGMLGSGDVSGLSSNSAMQNLLVMSASNAGLSYADLLTNGLTSENTNKLLASMVDYLSDIADSNNKVVEAQYGAVFGMSMSDLKAIGNLSESVNDVYSSNLTYSGSINYLNTMADTISQRMSTGEMLGNIWDNVQYGISAGIANSPVLYGIWKVANLLEDTVGGIAIPAVSAAGFGIDLETTVADLMQVGALSGGILSSMGTLLSGITAGSSGGFSGAGMLQAVGVSGSTVKEIARGTGLKAGAASGATVSQSTFIGNNSGSDVYDSTMSSATDTVNQKTVEAKESEDDVEITEKINDNVANIYSLLQNVVSGSSSLHVQADGLFAGLSLS